MKGDRAAPSLLVVFFAATLVMVLALVLLFQDGARSVDFAALALLLAVTALFLRAVARQADEQEPPDEQEPDR